MLLLMGLAACSSSTVNCGPCGPAVQVRVSGLAGNVPARVCLPDVGSGSGCVTLRVTTAANGAHRCQVAGADGRPSRIASCAAASDAGTAYLIDRRGQPPSAYRGTSVTAGRTGGRFTYTKGQGRCGCDRAVASIDPTG